MLFCARTLALRLLALAASACVAAPTLAQSIRAIEVAPSADFFQPLDAASPPNDFDRLFVVEQGGKIRIVNIAANTASTTPFLDVGEGGSNLIAFGGEQGLLGLAFHPDYANNGYFFINYTRKADGGTVIARYRANTPYATSNTANPASATIIRSFAQPFANHNGGHLAFGPDGMLYVSSGDGGSGGDPFENSQNRASLLGKILRFDVNNAAANYIPADNPFVGQPGRAPEIWAYGVRNPWRIAFDKFTGDLWIGDVGQESREEIDFQPALTPQNYAQVAGRNYGWDCREGKIANPDQSDVGCNPSDTSLVDPIYDYVNNTSFCSVTGGVVYRGGTIPSLWGAYLYADLCANVIRSFRYDGSVVYDPRDWTSSLTQPSGPISSIVGFAEDGAGEVYVINIQGAVYKIVPGAGDCGCPCTLGGAEPVLFTDTFQANTGWTVSGASTGGAWQRGTPINDPNNPFDPSSDSDGSGACFVTGNVTGNNSDLDGTTILTSPALDLRGATLCFDYYLNMSASGGADGISVQLSADGSTQWTQVTLFNDSNSSAWTAHAITPAQVASLGLTLTSTSRIRFVATDAAPDSTLEAGIDNFKVYGPPPFPDCNTNGVDDAADIAAGTSEDCNSNGTPDECDVATGAVADYDGGPTGIRADGGTMFNTSCVGCHGQNGTGATGPNIRNKPRLKIRERLLLIVPHPGGGFPNSTQQTFANLEAFLADFGSRGRPDLIPDSCQLLPDCDSDGISDGQELELGTQIDADYDGKPDDCTCLSDFNQDGFSDAIDYDLFIAAWLQSTPSSDINEDGFSDAIDYDLFIAAFFSGC